MLPSPSLVHLTRILDDVFRFWDNAKDSFNAFISEPNNWSSENGWKVQSVTISYAPLHPSKMLKYTGKGSGTPISIPNPRIPMPTSSLVPPMHRIYANAFR